MGHTEPFMRQIILFAQNTIQVLICLRGSWRKSAKHRTFCAPCWRAEIARAEPRAKPSQIRAAPILIRYAKPSIVNRFVQFVTMRI